MHIYHALINALSDQMIGVGGGVGVERESSGCWKRWGGGLLLI